LRRWWNIRWKEKRGKGWEALGVGMALMVHGEQACAYWGKDCNMSTAIIK
jgi:hypothetical protein